MINILPYDKIQMTYSSCEFPIIADLYHAAGHLIIIFFLFFTINLDRK